MTKLIVITGGVYSGLGKGIAGASIGKLLKASRHSVTMIKCDPYLHVDAGTMNPYSHGEVFVCEDGTETDLDLWHYERFIDTNMSANNSVTSGKIYLDTLNRERAWAFLGQNVQVIPHITDAIKQKIYECSQWYDVIIVEIWWTVWDIESPAFYEAVRQLGKDLFVHNTMYIHVAPIVYMPHTGEEKTKPLQHSVRDLRQTGIYPDILLCRTQNHLNEETKLKLSTLCGLSYQYIFESVQAESIYQVPLHFFDQWLHNAIVDKLWLDMSTIDLSSRKEKVHNLIYPKDIVVIWLVGKYTQLSDSDLSLIEAIKHAWANHSIQIKIISINPETLESDDREHVLKNQIIAHNIIWIVVPWWFGVRWTQGMINAITYARIHCIPFVWICYGMQLAVIEFARNVCGLLTANSVEIDSQTLDPVIDIMPEQKNITHKWWTMRLWSYQAILEPWSLVATLYKSHTCNERHRHRYEVNMNYHDILQTHGLLLSGMSPDKRLVEFIELPWHPYFVGTQAHPELKSRLEYPSPLFDGLICAMMTSLWKPIK
jgi:CTP synthase